MARPRTPKQRRSPYYVWFQIILHDQEDPILIRKFISFDGAILHGDGLCRRYGESFQTIFLIDGKLTEEQLRSPNSEDIWNTWEAKPFRDYGVQAVAFNPLEQILGNAAASARKL